MLGGMFDDWFCLNFGCKIAQLFLRYFQLEQPIVPYEELEEGLEEVPTVQFFSYHLHCRRGVNN